MWSYGEIKRKWLFLLRDERLAKTHVKYYDITICPCRNVVQLSQTLSISIHIHEDCMLL